MPLEQQAPPEHTPPEHTPPKPLTKPRLKKRPKPKPDHCLNCGTAVMGNFCAECGQENEDQTVAVKLLVGDLLSDLASFDSKLLRTLIPLAIRPGFLTSEYNAGRRVRYLSPFKLYLTASVLFFLALPLTHHGSLLNVDTAAAAPAQAGNALRAARQTADARVKADADLQDAQADLKADLQDDAPGLKLSPARHYATLSLGRSSYDLTHLPATVAAYDARQRDPRRPPDPKPVQYLLHQIIKVKQSPQSLSAALLNYIPKMMFVLLPAFALSLKVLYLRSKRLYIEHLIFSLHLHAFWFLLLTLLLAAQALLPHAGFMGPIVAVAALVYPYAAMRAVYKQGWGKTLVKYNLLAVNYVLLFTLSLLGALAVAILVM